MNDDQQVQNQRSVQAPIATPAAQKVSDQPTQASQPTTSPSVAPASAPTKEHAPVAAPEVKIQEVAKAPEISQELKEAGVEAGADAKEQKLPEEVKKAGVTPAKDANPFVPGPATQKVLTLPMTYDEVLIEEKKEKSAKNSISWKIREILREWKKQLLSSPNSS